MTMPLLAQTEHFAVGSIEGCEQRRRPIPFVVMGPGLATSAFERQARLRAIQGLDLTLLIQTQHHGPHCSSAARYSGLSSMAGAIRIRSRLLDIRREQNNKGCYLRRATLVLVQVLSSCTSSVRPA